MAAVASSNVDLSSLRWLLFLFFGGIGAILPLLPLHTRAIGLTLDEARLISIISPFLALLGPLIAGPLVDYYASRNKTQNKNDIKLDNNAGIRGILACAIFFAGFSYSLLLAVPIVSRLEPRQPAVSFACSDKGAILMQERCNELEGCYQYARGKFGAITLTSCKCDFSTISFPDFDGDTTNSMETEVVTTSIPSTRAPPPPKGNINEVKISPDYFDNNEDNTSVPANYDDIEDEENEGSGHTAGKRSAEWKEPPPPHICYGSPLKCEAFLPHSSPISVNISLKQVSEEKDYCLYPLGNQVSCRIPNTEGGEGTVCSRLICDLKNAYVPGSVLQQSQCSRTIGDPNLTFWLYLFLRIFGDLFMSVSISLLIGSTLSAVRLHIGQEFLAPVVAYALFSALGGYLQSADLTPVQQQRIPPYFIGIATFGILTTACVFILIFSSEMPIGPPDWWSSSRLIRFRHRNEYLALLLILTLLGSLWGPHFGHVPWHLAGTKGLEVYIGCSLAFGALLSLPFVWKVDFIIDYCGYSNILITGFTFYILRYTGLLFIESPWVLFLTGGMEVFTLCLVFFSAILYIRHLVPKNLTFTAQSLGFAAQFCLGNGIGCMVATLVSPSENEIKVALDLRRNTTSSEENTAEDIQNPYHLLYCTGAITAAIIAAVYFIVYHCCLKKKCLAPPYRKTNNSPTLVQGSAGNGTYTPLQVFQNGHQHQAD